MNFEKPEGGTKTGPKASAIASTACGALALAI